VSRDEGSTLALITLDELHEIAVLMTIGVNWQVAAHQSYVAEPKLLSP
jgi:hypothetical protein